MSGLVKEPTAKTLLEEQKKLELTLHSLKMSLKSGGTKFERAALARIIKQVERRNSDPNAIKEAQEFISKNAGLLDKSRMDTMNAALTHLSEIHRQRETLEFTKAELELGTLDEEKSDSVSKRELKEITKALDKTKPSFLQRAANAISDAFSAPKQAASTLPKIPISPRSVPSPTSPVSSKSLDPTSGSRSIQAAKTTILDPKLQGKYIHSVGDKTKTLRKLPNERAKKQKTGFDDMTRPQPQGPK